MGFRASAPITVRIADEIRAEMARLRRTQEDYAAFAGMSQSAVSNRLAGKTPLDVAELDAICTWLGIDVASLIDRARASAMAS